MANWIWYPGSFELYHSMLLHNRRTTSKTYENGTRKSVYYYPMWRIDGPKHNAILEKTATIDESIKTLFEAAEKFFVSKTGTHFSFLISDSELFFADSIMEAEFLFFDEQFAVG